MTLKVYAVYAPVHVYDEYDSDSAHIHVFSTMEKLREAYPDPKVDAIEIELDSKVGIYLP